MRNNYNISRYCILRKTLYYIALSSVFLLNFVNLCYAQENNNFSEREENNQQLIIIKSIKVIGSTVFVESDFLRLIKPLLDKTVTRDQLQKVVEQINKLYLDNNYVTSDAVLVEDTLTTGNIQIAIIEGGIEEIIIEGNKKINSSYIRNRIARGATTPFNPSKLEDQLKLLRLNPLFKNVSATLKKGNSLNQSILVVKVEEANPFTGKVEINNYSPPSVGSEKFEIDLNYGNLTGNGDKIYLNYDHTFAGGSDNIQFGYNLPVNSLDGSVSFGFNYNSNEVIQEPFDQLNITGESIKLELNYRQPLFKNPREELALSVSFAYEDGQTFLLDQPTGFGFGPNEEGVSRTSVINFAQDYLSRNQSGVWSLRSQFNFGIGIFDATTNAAPIPDGLFFSWLGQIQRVQVLSPNNFLIIQGNFQLTPDSLLPAQQFIIGGGQSLRGYRQNYLAGDNGVRLSIEDRIIVKRDENGLVKIQLAPFFDFGTVWNSDNNPNIISQEKTAIASLGLGLLWQPVKNFKMRFDYGIPLIEINDEGNNAQDKGFYFSAGYEW